MPPRDAFLLIMVQVLPAPISMQNEGETCVMS